MTKPQNKWIKYLDQKPKDHQRCWVCLDDNRIIDAEYQIYHEMFGYGFGNYDEFILEKYVKFWMPYFTPTPPHENDNHNIFDKNHPWLGKNIFEETVKHVFPKVDEIIEDRGLDQWS